MLKCLKIIALLLLVSLLFHTEVLSQSPNLPLDHWAYRFLERLEIKDFFESEDFNIRPYTREAIAGMILQIDDNVQRDASLMSKVERDLFEQLKGEFHAELKKITDEVEISESEYEPHLFSWKSDEFVFTVDAALGEQIKLESKANVDASIPTTTTSVGYNFRANFKESMVIASQARSFILTGADSLINTNFDPSLGLPVTKKALFDLTISQNLTFNCRTIKEIFLNYATQKLKSVIRRPLKSAEVIFTSPSSFPGNSKSKIFVNLIFDLHI